MTYVPAANRYSRVDYARCGRSGLKLPRLALGLWHNFGGVDPFENGRAMVRAAFDLGITHFDLANNYGPPPGSAEEAFGRMLRADFGGGLRDELIIATKAGYDMWPGPYGDFGSRKYLLASLDQSLRRMGLDYVDIFYSHRPDPETPIEETMGALAQAVRSGKALYVGVSNYDARQTRRAQTELGVGCIPFSPLAQGQLTSRYLASIPSDSRAARGHFLKPGTVEANHRRIVLLAELAEKRGQTLAQMALTWVLRQPAVTTVLIGASSVAQIQENVASSNAAGFSPEELTAIDQACN
jgi:L-glyceraldehyde 3-phosphate reductase